MGFKSPLLLLPPPHPLSYILLPLSFTPSLPLLLSLSLVPACIPSFQLVKPEEIHHGTAPPPPNISHLLSSSPPFLCLDGSVTFSQLADLTGSSALLLSSRSSSAMLCLRPSISLFLKCYSHLPGDKIQVSHYVIWVFSTIEKALISYCTRWCLRSRYMGAGERTVTTYPVACL